MSNLTVDTSRHVPPSSLFNFNLADPDEITHMLETVDLTDEDTDVLLQEAYSINKKLKEILRRREEGIELDPSEEALLQGQTVVVVPGSALEPRSSTADASASRDPAFSKKEALPPIKSSDNEGARVASAIYSAKLGRRPVPPSSGMVRGRGMPGSRQPSGVHRSPPSAISRGSRHPSAGRGRKSSRGGASAAKGKVREKAPVPIEERPQWNDRFSV
ncbi:hypothetical protein FSP39_013689 [Pinctada imbricata]|uniref:Uncharacterized protein n=1 Tax=Pinctada imbricata TaxID=66713 RepID=A0AA88YAU9_PINIB|nr:hypothetical protein FSP39_013689 [Pinctada imbricata]